MKHTHPGASYYRPKDALLGFLIIQWQGICIVM